VGGKYKPRGRTKEESNELRKASWTPEKRAIVAAANRKRAEPTRNRTDKVCGLCRELKSLTNFHKNKNSSDGRTWLCKPCNIKKSSDWDKANIDRVRARPKKDNSEYFRNLYANNADRIKKRIRQHRVDNPAKTSAMDNEKRAKRLHRMPTWLTLIQKAEISAFYEIASAKTMQTDVQHHVDHVVPLLGKKVSGLHVPWNLQVLTATENLRKHARFEVN
jgi:hypothetical protein